MRIFHTINHKFLSRLNDSFIKWDKKVNLFRNNYLKFKYLIYYNIFKLSSIFVCCVMDNFGKKDLASYLNDSRSKREQIPLQVLYSIHINFYK